MEKWKLFIFILFLVFGIAFLLLGVTNSFHNLFDLSTKNGLIMMGSGLIIFSFIIPYFLKKYGKVQVKYPLGVFLGIMLLLIGTSYSISNIFKGLNSYYFPPTGYFLVGFLYLTLFYLTGITLIVESTKNRNLTNL